MDVGVGEDVEEKHRVADLDWEALPVGVMVAVLVTSPVGDTRAVEVAQGVLLEERHWEGVEVWVGEDVEEKHRVKDMD